jgi:succinyl-CoA synthetase alpha subunit
MERRLAATLAADVVGYSHLMNEGKVGTLTALKRMGHAGAIVLGDKGSFAAKRKVLEAAGATVVDTPTEIGPALHAGMGC